jgi:hypothetical protein
MPADIVLYYLSTEVKPVNILYESSDKKYVVAERTLNVYNSANLENAKIIGTSTNIYTLTVNSKNDNVCTFNAFIEFNETSGVPYGSNNILVWSNTFINNINPVTFLSYYAIYNFPLNTNLSTGEYANQVGYREYIKLEGSLFWKNIIHFPLPTVTYTNAFNSLPQPSTAPLPS